MFSVFSAHVLRKFCESANRICSGVVRSVPNDNRTTSSSKNRVRFSAQTAAAARSCHCTHGQSRRGEDNKNTALVVWKHSGRRWAARVKEKKQEQNVRCCHLWWKWRRWRRMLRMQGRAVLLRLSCGLRQERERESGRVREWCGCGVAPQVIWTGQHGPRSAFGIDYSSTGIYVLQINVKLRSTKVDLRCRVAVFILPGDHS